MLASKRLMIKPNLKPSECGTSEMMRTIDSIKLVQVKREYIHVFCWKMVRALQTELCIYYSGGPSFFIKFYFLK